MTRFTLILFLFCTCSESISQEPTKDEWIAAMRAGQVNKNLPQLKKAYEEIRDAKLPSKREKQTKLEKAKAELVAEKKRIWKSSEGPTYPQIDAYSLKKGDIGIIVTSLSELTNRPALSSQASAAEFIAQSNDMATMVQSYRVAQVLNANEFLCNCGKTMILVSGMSTSDLRNDKHIEKIGPMYCIGNATYPTAAGTTNTVMKVVPVSSATADKLTEECKRELQVSRVRTWTDVTGKHKTEAELIDYDGKKVTIKKTDGTETVLPIGRISKADRDYAEDVLGAPEK